MATNLHRISVAGFKSIKTMDLELRDLNVLIGANGAGKSNFVGLFTLLGQLVEERLQVFVGQAGGPDVLLTNGVKATEKLVLNLHFGAHGYKVELVPTETDELIFEKEVCSLFGSERPKPYELPLGGGHKETWLTGDARIEKVVRHVLDSIKGWRVYHFQDTSRAAKVKQIGEIGDNAALRGDAANLAAFLFRLRETQESQYRQIVETIRLVAPFFDDFQLRPYPTNTEKIRLEWRAKGTDAYFTAHALSDGTLRFICLATLLLQPVVPSVIVVDEPELGLHPYAITLLGSLLKAAAKRTQVIVATQSVSLVNQFEPEHIVVVDRDAEGSVFHRPTVEETVNWLDDYSLGELWEKNILGGRPR